MQLAYLILAHKNPEQLLRLVKSLADDNSYFIIHIDKKVDEKPFRRLFQNNQVNHIHFIRDRKYTEWGSFEIVEATLNCLRYTAIKLKLIERIILLSGQDYPIKSKTFLHKYLEANRNRIFMDFFEIPFKNWHNGGRDRFPLYDEAKQRMDLFGGAQWISFPMFTVKIIFDFLKLNPDFISYFKMVDIPDESFFQTLLLNCDERSVTENIINKSLHLIKWAFPFAHPISFSLQHYAMLKQSKCLFARKFDFQEPSFILNKIDDEILSDKKYIKSQRSFPQAELKPRLRQVILFLTKKVTQANLKAYNKLKKNILNDDTYLIYHKTDTSTTKIPEDCLSLVFDNSILKSMNFKSIFDTLVPGSNHFPLLLFYKQNPQYSYYWYIEDDVRYMGGWDNFFNYFSDTPQTDFLTSHIRTYDQEPYWYWWNTLKAPGEQTKPNMKKIRSFNPIFRISNQALAFLYDCLLSGWSGHHEVLIPTLLNGAGFTINDFGGDGDFVLQGCHNKFYVSKNDSSGTLDSGTMRFRPIIDLNEMDKSFLYHPVKTDG